MIAARGLGFAVGSRPILRGLDFTVAAGDLLLVCGRNGAGKSTLLRLLAGRLAASCGQALLAGRDLSSYGRRELATRLSYLPQGDEFSLPLLVRDVLRAGRYPYRNLFRGFDRRDQAAFAAGVEKFGLAGLLERNVQTLSGGERKKVLLAAAFIQDVPLLLLDEPLAALDPGSSLGLASELAALQREGKTIVVVSHEIERFLPLATRMLALDRGELCYFGPKTFSPALLHRVFGVTFRMARVEGREIVYAEK